jgi:serine/threonine-protein kinase RsbW
VARPYDPSAVEQPKDMNNETWLWRAAHVIPSEPEAAREVLDELLTQLREKEWGQHDVFGIHLAMEEALMNAIKHGNRLDPRKCVRVACKLADDRVRIEVADEGPGFDPRAVPDCTDDDRLEIPSGRGLMLMKSFMSRVEYNDTGNSVVMEKDRVRAE